MVDTLRESYPALVDDVVPDKVPLGVLHRVLQRLLGEGIPIRDLVTILECLADAPEGATDPEALTERVRSALGPVIAERFSDDDGVVHAVTVGPRFEAALMELFHPSQGDPRPGMLDPDLLTELLSELEGIWKERESAEEPTVLLAPAGLRVGLRRLVEPVLPEIPVLSLAELPSRASVESVGQWEVTGAAEAA
jgi:flagellar biosynthesis protein FlhA